jgi:ribose-phosphate pyrophosphokinase
MRFADEEIFVDQRNVRGEDVFVPVDQLPANDNLMELLICIDARRASAKRITAVIPYFGYARQDRNLAPDPDSASLSPINHCAGASESCRSTYAGQIQGFFDIPTDNLFASPDRGRHPGALQPRIDRRLSGCRRRGPRQCSPSARKPLRGRQAP